MTITATSTCVPVTLTDEQGYPTGKEVSVFIDYAVSVDACYGEDGDGRQGIQLVEYDILDAYIEAGDLKGLTEDQASWAIEEACEIFHQRQKHF
jgi:hypothetical protein